MSPPEIVEMAIVDVDGLSPTDRSKCWRLRPKRGISPMASRIHGIWERDVADAPEMRDVADDVWKWLEDRPIIGHNVRVDYDVVSRELPDWRPQAAIDTLRVARELLPNQEKYGLEKLGVTLGLDVVVARETGGVAHSALYDARLSAQLLKYLLEPLPLDKREEVLLRANILREVQGSLL